MFANPYAQKVYFHPTYLKHRHQNKHVARYNIHLKSFLVATRKITLHPETFFYVFVSRWRKGKKSPSRLSLNGFSVAHNETKLTARDAVFLEIGTMCVHVIYNAARFFFHSVNYFRKAWFTTTLNSYSNWIVDGRSYVEIFQFFFN